MTHRFPLIFSSVFLLLVLSCGAAPFEKWFQDQTLRIDYFHTGDARREWIALDRLVTAGVWPGRPDHLIAPQPWGRYRLKLLDAASGRLIFRRTYDSYFAEYQTTSAAINGEKRTYHESVNIPLPRLPVRVIIEKRDNQNQLKRLFDRIIDPDKELFERHRPDDSITVVPLMINGAPRNHVDVLVLAEGYRSRELIKFKKDLARVKTVLFSREPYQSLEKRFNLVGIFKPSQESGCDEPRKDIFRRTAFDASFNALGLERYMLTEANRAIHDAAAHVPHDTIIILVNSARYGGGGIYNQFCTVTADNIWFAYVLVHEFGHSFTGLADEYYSSSVAYNDFYPSGIEPVEPNITRLLKPESIKWKAHMSPGTPLPTPWQKQTFDMLEREYRKAYRTLSAKIAQMEKQGADRNTIGRFRRKQEDFAREHSEKMNRFLGADANAGTVGAFEGAGYASTGLYRPMIDCIMFSKGEKPYCRVCAAAVEDMIRYYSGGE